MHATDGKVDLNNDTFRQLMIFVDTYGSPENKTIEELRDIAYAITGEPEPVQFGDRVVGIIEARDGTIMDVVRQIKKFEFKD